MGTICFNRTQHEISNRGNSEKSNSQNISWMYALVSNTYQEIILGQGPYSVAKSVELGIARILKSV